MNRAFSPDLPEPSAAVKVILSIEPIRFPLTGIGRYTLELARSLEACAGIDLRYLAAWRLTRELPVPEDREPAHAAVRRSIKQRLIRSALVVESVQTVRALQKWRTLQGSRDSIFHGPNFYLPAFSGPSVATIHDLSIYTWAQYHPPERVHFMRREIDLTLKRASHLITDSEYTRREVAAHFGWPLDRVTAIPLAASDQFRPRSGTETGPVLRQYGLEHEGYCFYTGTIEPRKNIDALLDAYLALPACLRERWPLVLCGYTGWKSEALHARIADLERRGRLRYLGFVPQDHLPALMSGARAFAFPSLYEGFGLPVMEAMASGVPVVTSNAASLPEVTGDIALTCDPTDTDGLTALLRQALEDEAWRTATAARGIQWARTFSWQRCARETLAVYRRLQP
jgi:glycosyltransferase involved in cell wall biosynthesis